MKIPLKPSQRTLLVAACLLAAVLRLGGIDADSLWTDESATWRATRANLTNLSYTINTLEIAPPLYPLLMNRWTRLAGDGEIALRLPSVLAGVLTVAALGVLARRLLGRAVAFPAALILAAAPFHIWYSQEARNYTLFGLLVVLSTLALWRAWQRGGLSAWLAYFVPTLLACYTHYFAAYFVAAQGLFVFAASLGRRRFSSRGQIPPGWLAGPPVAGPWLACMAGVALLWLPWLPWFLRSRWEYADWIGVRLAGRSALDNIWLPVREMAFGRTFPRSGLPAVLGYALAGGLAAWGLVVGRRGAPRAGFVVVTALATVPPLIAWIVSFFTPSLIARYISPALPFMVAVIALGVARLRPGALQALVLLAVLAGEFWSLGRTLARPLRPDWRGLAGYILEHSQPGDGATTEPIYNSLLLEYYLRGRVPLAYSPEQETGLSRLWLVELGEPSPGARERLEMRYPVEQGPQFYRLERLFLFQIEGAGPSAQQPG